MATRTLTFLTVLVLGGSGAGDAPTAAVEEAPSTNHTQPEKSSAPSQDDDPQNPWVLGYRCSGTPGMKIRVEWATRGPNYERLKESGDPQPFGKAEQNHETSLEPNVALASVFIKGLKIRATIKEGTGTFKIEMIRGRLVDRNDPMGAVEVKEVLETGEASGEGGSVILAAGETFDEQPPHW